MPGAKRCSVKKLFKAIDKNASGTITLGEVKKAFTKAAGKRKSLTYKGMKRVCNKYAGNYKVNSCKYDFDCDMEEDCEDGMCIRR